MRQTSCAGEWPDVAETNGTALIVDLELDLTRRVTLRLEKRGAELQWRSVDHTSGRHAFGRVSVRRCDGNPERRFDIHTSTSSDDPGHRLLLPEGLYCIGLMEIEIEGKRRYPDSASCVLLELRSGERYTVDLPFDVNRLLRQSTFVQIPCPEMP